ncbi:MAG: hypothetical protein AAF577_01255 [Pseudomonadota bacterium]
MAFGTRLFLAAAAFSISALGAAPGMAATLIEGDVIASGGIGGSLTEADFIQSGAASFTVGDTTIYVGTRQVSATNQNPVVASFTNGVQDWRREDYETGAADGRGRGVVWDGLGQLYAAFTIDGGQSSSVGFEAFTLDGWGQNYGSGGGPSVAVLLRLDPATGDALGGTYVISQLSSGNTNTVVPLRLGLRDGAGAERDVFFAGDAFFLPLSTDRSRMTAPPGASSPFEYRLLFDAALENALVAEAAGLTNVQNVEGFDALSDAFLTIIPLPASWLGLMAALGLVVAIGRDRGKAAGCRRCGV